MPRGAALVHAMSTKKLSQRKLWLMESMTAALRDVQGTKGLRYAACIYNVPVETLQRKAGECRVSL